MKISTLFLDTLRELWKSRNRFLSIVAIVALGTGFFSGIQSTTPNMKHTADLYYQATKLSDFHLLSTFGITEDDIIAIASLSGIKAVMPGYSADVLVKLKDDTESIVKLHSLPLVNHTDDLNQPVLSQGRMPSQSGECLYDDIGKHDFTIGDEVAFVAEALDNMVSISSCTIVGLASSSRYISFERGNSQIGNGIVSAFLFLPEQDFAYEFYTDLYLQIENEDSSFSAFYDEKVADFQEQLESLAKERGEIRYSDIMIEAREEIDEAKEELAKGKLEAKQKLQDGYQKIRKAEADLATGKETLANETASAQVKIADARRELADGEATYQSEYASFLIEIADAQKKIDDGWMELNQGQSKLDRGAAQLADAKAEFAKQKQIATAQLEAAEAGLKQLQDSYFGPLSLWISSLDLSELSDADKATATQFSLGASVADMTELAQLLTAFGSNPSLELQQTILAYVNGYISAAQGQIAAGYAQLAEGAAQISNAQSELNQGQRELNQGRIDLESAQTTLLEEKAKALVAFEEAKIELEDGKAKLMDAEKELEEETAKAMVELQDGEAKIAQAKVDYAKGKKEADEKILDGETKLLDAEKELAKLEKPQWYVFDRSEMPGYASYGDDAERVENVAAVFPIFFILIAALVCLTTMTRMVEEQRTLIGTLKALGYSQGAIVMKYLIYAFLASILGSVIGLGIGLPLFPIIIYNAYRIMYHVPDLVLMMHWNLIIGSVVIAILCTTISAYFACRHELISQPSQLMRPKAPKSGKRVLLERIPWIWNRVSFLYKITLRNLFRYKNRVFLTMLGIGGCTALMLTGFGLQYSIASIADKQYGEIFQYDAIGALEEHLTSTEINEVSAMLKENPYLSDSMYVYQKSVDVKSVLGEKATQKKYSVYLFVPSEPKRIADFINFQTRTTKTPLTLQNDGVIITEKLGKLLGVKVGDQIEVNDANQKRMVNVSGIAENYTMNYVYMTPQYYKSTFQTAPVSNLFIANMENETEQSRSLLSSELLDSGSILGVSYSRDTGKHFADMIGSLNVIVVVLIVCAGALAFVVLYNLTNINVNERLRELATIKVLGFYDGEVSAYIYRENSISAFLGMLAGLGMGVFLHQFVIQTAEVELVMFTPTINFYSYLFACILTIFFTVIVNVALHFRLKRIDMVESLKSVE